MDLEWLAQDPETLAHTSRLKISGKSVVGPQVAVVSPQHASTRAEHDQVGQTPPKTALVIAGEALTKHTIDHVGYSAEATDALLARLKTKLVPDRINLVYPRVPGTFDIGGGRRAALPPLDETQMAALVDVQLGADAQLVMPPLQSGLDSLRQFRLALERTLISIQTSHGRPELVGYFPTTDKLDLIPDMVAAYVKAGARFFAIDFSGASNAPSMMRTLVGRLRVNLRLGKRADERAEKYYLHVLNVATSKKSTQPVTPLSDIITHPYGVDSTSGVMWGGGTLDVGKLRYYGTADYGAYRPVALKSYSKTCSCPTCSGYSFSDIYTGASQTVFRRLRRHRVHAYSEECIRISERISAGDSAASYWPYLTTKASAELDIKKIMRDVREVRANLR